jgi:SAM-dependent methyltransferase
VTRELNPRQELIGLLRGQVACPLLSCLGELGWLDRMSAGRFARPDFPAGVNEAAFSAIIGYLTSLGLIAPAAGPESYAATALGQTVFARYGAFCLLHSYEDYFRSFRALLVPDGSAHPTVDRRRNVLGSGQLHARKFFPAALALTEGKDFRVVADLGCGDGTFLELLLRQQKHARAIAFDISIPAVHAASERLRAAFPGRPITAVGGDAGDLASWTKLLPNHDATDALLVSMWFLVHEISGGKAATVVAFFEQVRQAAPRAELLVGEIVRLPPATLARVRGESIMPEFTLFHDLSGQGLLTADAWHEVESRIPYRMVARRDFDPVPGGEGPQPSSFVWHLAPR